jgi:hypothetical protein
MHEPYFVNAKPILTFLLVLCGLLASAQKYTWGVKSGGTVSINSFVDQVDRDEFSSDAKFGFLAAGLINFPLKKNYSLQSELGFSQRGRITKFNYDSSVNKASYQFLELGLLARKSFPVKWGEHIPGNWFLNAGPRISHWIAGKGKVTGVQPFDYSVVFGPLSEVPRIEPDKMYLKNTNRWLLAIDVGVGVDAPVLKTHDILVELRYSYGFIPYGARNSAYNSTPGFRDSLKATEQVLSLSVGYTFTHDLKEKKKGKSTKQDRKKLKPRKEIDSMLN